MNIMELTTNKSVLDWISEKADLVKPDKIVWIDGSEEQLDGLRKEAVETGEMIKLNEEKQELEIYKNNKFQGNYCSILGITEDDFIKYIQDRQVEII